MKRREAKTPSSETPFSEPPNSGAPNVGVASSVASGWEADPADTDALVQFEGIDWGQYRDDTDPACPDDPPDAAAGRDRKHVERRYADASSNDDATLVYVKPERPRSPRR